MTKLKALLIGASAIVLISDLVSFAGAQSALGIGDNDSVLIDRKSFTRAREWQDRRLRLDQTVGRLGLSQSRLSLTAPKHSA
jgi:hypothetical protein